MFDLLPLKGDSKIMLITNNVYSKKLTVNVLEKYLSEKSLVELQIIDLEDNSISSLISNNKLKKRISYKDILEIIDKYDVSSYPAILILKENVLIESIFGGYDNILNILDIYL